MPAMVVLHALRPGDPRTGELLTRMSTQMEWTERLELGRDSRVEIPFLSMGHEDSLHRVVSALEGAGEELGVDWTDYFVLPSGP